MNAAVAKCVTSAQIGISGNNDSLEEQCAVEDTSL